LMHAMNIKKPAALHAQVGNFVTWVWNNQCLRNDAYEILVYSPSSE
jgi:plastocyanin